MLPTRYASLSKRFIAFVVDIIIVMLLVGTLEAALGALWLPLDFIGNLTKWVGLRNAFDSMVFHLPGILRGQPSDIPGLLVLAIIALYHAAFEAGPRQATPGKMLFGLFVADQNGQRISWRRGLGRGFGRLVSIMTCFIGFFVALLAPRNQALHDMMAHTLVLEPESPVPSPPAQGPQY
jgi:uncharacterized RDD family membrane protein YckC